MIQNTLGLAFGWLCLSLVSGIGVLIRLVSGCVGMVNGREVITLQQIFDLGYRSTCFGSEEHCARKGRNHLCRFPQSFTDVVDGDAWYDKSRLVPRHRRMHGSQDM